MDNILDISMNSPTSFSLQFKNEKKKVYITSSVEETEKWIEHVSEFTTTSLRTLLTKGAKLPEWVPDSNRSSCTICKEPFSVFFRRRHHCRACGEVVCYECADHFLTIPWMGVEEEQVRVCDYCVKHWS